MAQRNQIRGNTIIPLTDHFGFGLPGAAGDLDSSVSARVIASNGDPNGLPAPGGSLALDYATPAFWLAVDAVGTWFELSAASLGAFRVVADLTARDALPTAERQLGMRVYVRSTDEVYTLTGGLADTDWAEPTESAGTRRLLNAAPLGADLYVDPAGGDDEDGDGTVGSPYATVLRAIRDIGLVNDDAVTIHITGGTAALPTPLDLLNNVTLCGPDPTVVVTAAISNVVNATDAGGIVLDVTGIPDVVQNELKATPITWVDGVAANRNGWIYRNDVTAAGVTRLYVSQDGPDTLLVPGNGDSINLLQLGATLLLDEDSSTKLKTSIQFNVCDLILSDNDNDRSLLCNDSDKVDFQRCYFVNGRVRAGFGGSIFLTNCYMACPGSAGQGMVSAARGGNLRVANGTVFDGSTADANSGYISGEAGASITYRGQCVFTAMVGVTIAGASETYQAFDGTSFACVVPIAAHHSWLFDDGSSLDVAGALSGGLKFNARGQGGSRGGGQLPNLYGEVLNDYVVEAQDDFFGSLGPSSVVVTQHTLGVNNEVSANGDNTVSPPPNVAIHPDCDSVIFGGSPTTYGFSAAFMPLGTVAVPITVASTARPWERVLYDPTGGAFQIDAPASRAIGTRFGVKNVTANANNITVGGNGANSEDPGVPGTVAAVTGAFGGAGRSVEWEFNGTDWRIV